MHRFFAATARCSVRFRWPIVVGWLVATIAAGHFFPSLASVEKSNNTTFLPSSSPSLQAAKLASPFQGINQSAIPVVIATTRGPLTPADETAIRGLAIRLLGVPRVQRLKDLGASRDGQAVLLEVLANIGQGAQGPAQQLVADLRSAIHDAHLGPGLQAHLSGLVAQQVDANGSSQRQTDRGQSFTILFIIVLLLFVFRSVLAPLLTLLPAVLVTQLAGPIIGEASKAGLQVSSLTQIMLLVLVLGAGTDYGLFLVFRVREELRKGAAPHDAVVGALSRVGESITFSAATVIAALLSLLIASFGLYSSLGAPLAIGIALMLAAGLTLLPALLAIFGRAAFWPSNTKTGSARLGWWGRIASRIVARPARTLAIGILVFGGLALAALGYQPSGFGNTPAPPAGSDSAAGAALLAAHFPTSSANPTNVILRLPTSVWSDPAALVTAERELAAVPQFRTLNGPLDLNGTAITPAELVALHANPSSPLARAEAQFVSPDGHTVLFNASLAVGDPGSDKALNEVPQLRAAVAAVGRDVHATAVGLAGQAPAIYDVSRVSDSDLLHIVPVAILVIALLLALVMRSLIAPLYLIASVAVSYLAAFGLAVLLFQDATGSGGLSFFLPFLMFLFLLALGEDYNILVMTRIREEAGRIPLRQAVTRAIERTGSTVTSAGLVLAGTFGVFALVLGGHSGGSEFRDILAALAIGILMDAFLVRTLLVPSIVALLGRWNWWPSRHGDELARPDVDVPARGEPKDLELSGAD